MQYILTQPGARLPALSVVVPAFNHAKPLAGVLDRLSTLELPIIVVNDGSTDNTAEVLSSWVRANPAARVTLIGHPHNRGKAAALRSGFHAAAEHGATHVATIDADGQLDPEDIPRLAAEAALHPRALILGCRPREMEACPSRCTLGRNLTSFAVRAQCGLRLSDTQCGLRIYPVELVRAAGGRSSRYAFEAEIITRAAWAGFEVRQVPVSCRYFSGPDRISHWRPFQDSLRQCAVHVMLLAASVRCRRPSRQNLSRDTPAAWSSHPVAQTPGLALEAKR